MIIKPAEVFLLRIWASDPSAIIHISMSNVHVVIRQCESTLQLPVKVSVLFLVSTQIPKWDSVTHFSCEGILVFLIKAQRRS